MSLVDEVLAAHPVTEHHSRECCELDGTYEHITPCRYARLATELQEWKEWGEAQMNDAVEAVRQLQNAERVVETTRQEHGGLCFEPECHICEALARYDEGRQE